MKQDEQSGASGSPSSCVLFERDLKDGTKLFSREGIYFKLSRADVFELVRLARQPRPSSELLEAEQRAKAEPTDTDRLNFLDEECAELRCKEDRGYDDADVYFEVWKFFMSHPKERPVGRGSSAREAIDAAIRNEGDECCYCGPERNCTMCSPLMRTASHQETAPVCALHGTRSEPGCMECAQVVLKQQGHDVIGEAFSTRR